MTANQDGTTFIIPFIGFLGVAVGALLTAWLAALRDKARRRVEFRKQQLQELYGPLLSLRKEIRAHSILRVKLQNAIDQRHISDMLTADSAEGVEVASEPHVTVILKNISDEKQTFE